MFENGLTTCNEASRVAKPRSGNPLFFDNILSNPTSLASAISSKVGEFSLKNTVSQFSAYQRKISHGTYYYIVRVSIYAPYARATFSGCGRRISLPIRAILL